MRWAILRESDELVQAIWSRYASQWNMQQNAFVGMCLLQHVILHDHAPGLAWLSKQFDFVREERVHWQCMCRLSGARECYLYLQSVFG